MYVAILVEEKHGSSLIVYIFSIKSVTSQEWRWEKDIGETRGRYEIEKYINSRIVGRTEAYLRLVVMNVK